MQVVLNVKWSSRTTGSGHNREVIAFYGTDSTVHHNNILRYVVRNNYLISRFQIATGDVTSKGQQSMDNFANQLATIITAFTRSRHK